MPVRILVAAGYLFVISSCAVGIITIALALNVGRHDWYAVCGSSTVPLSQIILIREDDFPRNRLPLSGHAR